VPGKFGGHVAFRKDRGGPVLLREGGSPCGEEVSKTTEERRELPRLVNPGPYH